tara:strand:+ start:7 stop:1260 length:1254 start_codon:yes stop_codon:yes gene_type:complete
MADFVNNLRLTEIATGDESGSWGTITNTNLTLIGEALGFATQAITENADAFASTVPNGSTDSERAMAIKYTGALDSTCTVTLGPNTNSRLHYIQNATTDSGSSGPYSIIISQGSGAKVTIPNGDTKAVLLNGGGSGAIVTDLFASLSVVDLKVQDDLTVTDDVAIGGALTVTGLVTANANVLLAGTTPTLTIGDAGEEDAKIIYDGNAVDFHVGLDDTDDKLKIGLGSALGTTPILTVSDGSLLLSGTTPTLTIGDAGAEDAKIVFDGNAQDFHIGLDDTADDLVIGLGNALGTTPAISIDENLLVTVNDDVFVFGRATGTQTADNDGNFNLTVGNFWTFTPDGDDTITLTNPAIGQSGIIYLDNSGGHNLSAHASILINADVLSALDTAGKYMLSYYCTATSGDNTILMSGTGALA